LNKVLLIGCNDLITSGIASLLQRSHDVSLIHKRVKDIPQLTREIIDLQPATLILKNSLIFVNSSSMLELLIKFPDLRILTIDERKNVIHVYEKQEVQVNQSADLLKLIRRSKYLVKEFIAT
jgi:hypothetical protein